MSAAVDCSDSECSAASICLAEICYNGVDDDGDANIDCGDGDCNTFSQKRNPARQ